MNEWISVKEQLPNENVPVLIFCKNSARFVSEKKVMRWPDGEETYWIVRGPLGSGRKIASNRVTHWMPLPEPPEEE